MLIILIYEPLHPSKWYIIPSFSSYDVEALNEQVINCENRKSYRLWISIFNISHNSVTFLSIVNLGTDIGCFISYKIDDIECISTECCALDLQVHAGDDDNNYYTIQWLIIVWYNCSRIKREATVILLMFFILISASLYDSHFRNLDRHQILSNAIPNMKKKTSHSFPGYWNSDREQYNVAEYTTQSVTTLSSALLASYSDSSINFRRARKWQTKNIKIGI